MTKDRDAFSQMYFVKALEGEVQAWVNQGWQGVTQTILLISLTIGFSEVMMLKNNFMIVKNGLLKQLSIVVKY